MSLVHIECFPLREGLTMASGHGCALRLQRSARSNALDLALLDALVVAFQSAECRTARAVFLQGEGDVFSAGLDLKWLETLIAGPRSARETAGDALAAVLDTAASLEVPLISYAGRGAFGAGIALLAAADWVVADPTAHFRLSEARLGISGGILLKTLRRKVADSWLRRWVLTAGDFTAPVAVASGMVTELVPMAQWPGHQAALAAQFATAAPSVTAPFKRAMRAAAPLTTDGKLLADALENPDGKEGLRAFWERRQPNWS